MTTLLRIGVLGLLGLAVGGCSITLRDYDDDGYYTETRIEHRRDRHDHWSDHDDHKRDHYKHRRYERVHRDDCHVERYGRYGRYDRGKRYERW